MQLHWLYCMAIWQMLSKCCASHSISRYLFYRYSHSCLSTKICVHGWSILLIFSALLDISIVSFCSPIHWFLPLSDYSLPYCFFGFALFLHSNFMSWMLSSFILWGIYLYCFIVPDCFSQKDFQKRKYRVKLHECF